MRKTRARPACGRSIADRIVVAPARVGAILALLLLGGASAAATPSAAWPDSYVARLEALALLQTLNAELLSHDSATVTLERWCATHALASPARVVAVRVPGIEKEPSAEQRRELRVGPAEPVRYRRVRLECGPVVLSEADNWYVPGRLTPAMNRRLDTTDEPFGKVVRSLRFRRHTLSAALLWRPLPQGWEMQPRAIDDDHKIGDGPTRLDVPARLIEHRALLTLPDGTPISEVVETYTDRVLAFPPPPVAGRRRLP